MGRDPVPRGGRRGTRPGVPGLRTPPARAPRDPFGAARPRRGLGHLVGVHRVRRLRGRTRVAAGRDRRPARRRRDPRGRDRPGPSGGQAPRGRGHLPVDRRDHAGDHVPGARLQGVRRGWLGPVREPPGRTHPRLLGARLGGDPGVLGRDRAPRRSRRRRARERAHEPLGRAVPAGVPDDRLGRPRGLVPGRVRADQRRTRRTQDVAGRDGRHHRGQAGRGAPAGRRGAVPSPRGAPAGRDLPRGARGHARGLLHQPPGHRGLRVLAGGMDVDASVLERPGASRRPGPRPRGRPGNQPHGVALRRGVPVPQGRRHLPLDPRRVHARPATRRLGLLAGVHARHHRAQGGREPPRRDRAALPPARRTQPAPDLRPGDRPGDGRIGDHVPVPRQRGPDRVHGRGGPGRPRPVDAADPPGRPRPGAWRPIGPPT